MRTTKINFKEGNHISASALRKFFRRCQWYDYFTRKDIQHYLKNTLYVASAWHGQKVVGFAVLTGDGRNYVSLDSLVVDCNYQRRGIGSMLIKMAQQKIKNLKPYHFEAQVCDKKTEQFYRKFGFVKNKGTWLLEHASTAGKLRAKVNRLRKTKKVKN